jgi:uncharacterized sulfatase
MSGRYGTRFGFEFTPTAPGMMQLAAFARTEGNGTVRLRETMAHEDAEPLDYEDMGMPASEITLFEGVIYVPYFAKWPARIAPGTELAGAL